MSHEKCSSKGKRRSKAVSVLGIAGMSLAAMDGGAFASISGSAADIASQNTAPSQVVTLGEEEISDVTLSTFYVFDKENARTPQAGVQEARGGLRCSGVFLVEDIERRQSDVGDFFLTEGDDLTGCRVLQRCIHCRSADRCECSAVHRRRHPAIPNTDTALLRRFPFEEHFSCDIARSSSLPTQIRSGTYAAIRSTSHSTLRAEFAAPTLPSKTVLFSEWPLPKKSNPPRVRLYGRRRIGRCSARDTRRKRSSRSFDMVWA